MATKIVITPELDEEKLREQLDKLKNQKEKIKVDLDTENINSANQNMKKLNSTVSNSNTIFSRLKNTIGSTFSTGKLAMTGYLAVLNEINKAGKNAKQTINDLDKAITDLSVATNMSRESVSGLVRDYNDYAKELKSTTTQITSAADDYLRAGKSMSEAQTLIKDSIMLSKLGQLESGTATEDLLAVMNGYEMSIEEVGKALDAMVALDMAAATSSGDIATALKYCSSSADMAGVSFNKLAAMIATVQDKTQQSAETIGTFMNTLLSRYRDVKIGQFVSDDGEDLSDVEAVLNSLDIQLRDSSQEFRDFETIIEEVALSWDNYSSVQQAAIAKAFSGTRQQNRFLALMEGYAKTLELTEVAANSAGTAIEKFNNSYMNSLEAKQNALQASFESLIMNSDFSEVYAGIIEATTALVDFINQTNALKGALTGLTVAGGIKGFLAIKTGVNEAYIALNKFQNALNIVKKSNISTKEYERLLLLSNGLSTSQMKLVLSTNSLTVVQKKELLMASGLSEEEAVLQLQTWKMTAANTGLTASTVTLGNAFKALWSTLIANPLVIVTALISGAVMAYQAYNQKLEETRQKNIESATAASENADKLKDLYNEYKRLAPIQDRTTSEEEAFKTAVENITVALGDKAEILKDLTAGTDEYADALARATKEELQSQAVTATIGRKSAEEELQGEIWSDWKGSKVSIDSNSKGKSLSSEAQKAVAIVSESLKEYETVNRKWGNISWDISSNDPIEALEFYNSLVEAREKLVSASGDDEALLDTEIYEDLNTAINTMSESLDTYIEKLYEEEKLNYMAQNGIPSIIEEYKAMESALVSVAGSSVDLQDRFKELLTNDFSDLATNIENVSDAVGDASAEAESMKISFEDAWADSFTSEDDTVKELGNSLLELAEQGRLTIETFNNADSTDYFKNLGISADEAVLKINRLVDESKQLSSMSSQISSMADALGTKQEDGFVSADTLSGFDVEVRGLDSWDRFQEVLGSTTSSYEECQEAANALATEWVNSSDFLAQLTEQNREYYETQLEAMGIENYEEVISYAMALNEAKEVLAQSSLELGNATYDEIENLIEEGTYLGLTADLILALYDAKVAEQAVTLDSAKDCQNLINLAGDADRTSKSIELLIQLMEIYTGLENKVYGENNETRARALAKADSIKKELEAIANGETTKMEIEPTVKLGNRGKSSAKSAGKEAGKSYKDGLKEELSDLESVISGVTGKIDKQISSIKTQKEIAVAAIDAQIDALNEQKSALEAQKKALEEERDARIEIIEQQKKQLELAIKAIDKQIKAKEKIIKSINDEIKAMKDANEQRKLQLNLQKEQYALERLQNQRTILQYSEEKGMHYVTDTKGIRDQKQKVDDAKLEIEIANKQKQIDLIEKEIDLLNEKKDAINEQIELLDEQIEQIKEYYEEQIKAIDTQIDTIDKQIEALQKQREETEKYYELLIENLEKSKSKYEELTEIVGEAELSAALKQLGIDEEALLNGSEEEFEKLKNAYLDIVFKLNEGNDEVLNSLKELSGYEDTAPTVLTDTADKLDEVNEQLDTSIESMDKLSDSATTASKGTSDIATSMEELSTNTEGLSDNLTDINNALSDLPEAENIGNIAKAFTDMAKAIKDVADALGVGEEGTVGGLVGALQSLSKISLSEMGEDGQGGGTGIVSQFQALKTAVDDVTNAISGGGSSGGSGGGDASNSSSPSMSSGTGGEGASGLVGAIESFKTATDKALGSGGEEDSGADGEGSGAIGQFGQLKKAVDDVSDAIGKGDSEDGNGGSGEEDAANLIGAINNLGTTTENILAGSGDNGDESRGVIGRFEEFKNVIGEANEHVTGISKGLEDIDGQKVECTIKVNIETTGGLPAGLAGATGTALDTMNFNSAEYNAKYTGSGHYEGTAKVTGDWGVKQGGSTLVGELGQELVVFPNGRFTTVGDNGAEFVDIPKGSIVFNHLQTRELLSKGNLVGRGKALASGTALAQGNTNGTSDGSWIGADGHRYRDLQPGDHAYELQKAFEPLLQKWLSGEEEILSNAVFDGQKQFEKWTKEITNNTAISNVTNNKNMQPSISIGDINVTCPGVTSQEVMKEVGDALNKQIGHLSQRALQEQPRRY